MSDAKNRTGNSVPSFTPEIGKRINRVVSEIGTQIEAAKIAGVRSETIAGWKKGDQKPSLYSIIALCQAANISIDWLATGKEPMRLITAREPRSVAFRPTDILEGYAMVPELDVQASAGGGVIVDREDAIGQIAFDPQWLRERHINPSGARVLTAKGDSMEPTIRNGDTLIVDTSIEVAVDSAIYVVVYGGALLVKRIFMKRDGAIVLSSDNQALYAINEEIAAGEVDQLHIAGRVMWYGRAI